MEVIAHRGYWKKLEEKNTRSAFLRAFDSGFGVEVDLRDLSGEIVISHDPPSGREARFEELLRSYKDSQSGVFLALNVKADGLSHQIKSLLERYQVSNYFVFDMSVPDGLDYLRAQVNVFTRQSEYEETPVFYEQSQGVWLDEFHSHWITKDILEGHARFGKKICIVSPELHGRNHEKEWDDYKRIASELVSPHWMICTDYPEKAKVFHG